MLDAITFALRVVNLHGTDKIIARVGHLIISDFIDDTKEEACIAIQASYEGVYASRFTDVVHELFNCVPMPMDWTHYSWVIAKYFPEHLDADLYNWSTFSGAVAHHCPELLDKDKFNWEDSMWAVEDYCPELLERKGKL